jgi:hypothetical protein
LEFAKLQLVIYSTQVSVAIETRSLIRQQIVLALKTGLHPADAKPESLGVPGLPILDRFPYATGQQPQFLARDVPPQVIEDQEGCVSIPLDKPASSQQQGILGHGIR